MRNAQMHTGSLRGYFAYARFRKKFTFKRKKILIFAFDVIIILLSNFSVLSEDTDGYDYQTRDNGAHYHSRARR